MKLWEQLWVARMMRINNKLIRRFNMKKATLITFTVFLKVVAAFAQDSGIQFTKDSTWREVIQQAKREHKYIFVDCYASWCGPCKEMESDIYPLKQVGEAYNKDFISVKLQMDKTTHDSEAIKSWYDTADDLDGAYHSYN